MTSKYTSCLGTHLALTCTSTDCNLPAITARVLLPDFSRLIHSITLSSIPNFRVEVSCYCRCLPILSYSIPAVFLASLLVSQHFIVTCPSLADRLFKDNSKCPTSSSPTSELVCPHPESVACAKLRTCQKTGCQSQSFVHHAFSEEGGW
jgi:hypothetical protein